MFDHIHPFKFMFTFGSLISGGCAFDSHIAAQTQMWCIDSNMVWSSRGPASPACWPDSGAPGCGTASFCLVSAASSSRTPWPEFLGGMRSSVRQVLELLPPYSRAQSLGPWEASRGDSMAVRSPQRMPRNPAETSGESEWPGYCRSK